MVAIIVVNVLVFIWELLLGPNKDYFILAYGTVPFEITHGRDIPPQIPIPVYLTLFTSMFIHANIIHIASNMLFLWVFGDNVEDQFGHWGFLAFYLTSGLVAGLAQIAISPSERIPGVGASGAIAGVLAAYLLIFPQVQVRTLLFIGPFFTVTRIKAFFLIGFWILLQFIFGFASLGGADNGGVAYFAHIGGFIAGLILTQVFRKAGLLPHP